MSDTMAPHVDPSNREALEAWDGNDGTYWAENERIFDRSLTRYRRHFDDAAAIGTGEQVLDIGCGTGESTRDAARAADPGSVLGVDLSSKMIERARQRAAEEGLVNVRFEQADAQIRPFPAGAFDVAISRTGAMFFGDPVAAFTNIGRALRPGGRLALLVWRSLAENHWIRDFRAALAAGRSLPEPSPDSPGPFSLADPTRTSAILAAAGFSDISLHPATELMYFGDDADEAFRFVRHLGITQFLLRGLEPDRQEAALGALKATISSHETAEGVLYPSAAWVVTARR